MWMNFETQVLVDMLLELHANGAVMTMAIDLLPESALGLR